MIRASTKIITTINTRFLGVPYIHLDSELNIKMNPIIFTLPYIYDHTFQI